MRSSKKQQGGDPILRPREAVEYIGYQPSTMTPVYALVRAGRLPPPIKISSRCVGWRRSVLDAFVSACAQFGTNGAVDSGGKIFRVEVKAA